MLKIIPCVRWSVKSVDTLLRVVSGKVDVSRGSSLSSIPLTTDSPDRNGFVKSSNSEDSLDKRNGYGHSWWDMKGQHVSLFVCLSLYVCVCVCVLQSDIYSVSMVNIRTKLMCYWIFHETLSCFVCFSFSFLIQEWSLVAGLLFFGVCFLTGKNKCVLSL